MSRNPYETEARERWGDTDAYRESQVRTSQYSEADWQRIQAASQANIARFTAALNAGLTPESSDAMSAAEEHRLQICEFYYACDHAMHTNLADMYVADQRFTDFYDKHAPGLAAYVSAAIHANAIARA